jgi:hypothetical protein
MTVVVQVPHDRVHQTWPSVEHFFASVVPHTNGDFTLEQMKGKICTGAWGLIVFLDGDNIIGALSVTYENRLNNRVAFIPALAGEGLTNQDNWAQLKAIFARNGATYIEAAMRPATLRLWQSLGFSEKYRIAGVSL